MVDRYTALAVWMDHIVTSFIQIYNIDERIRCSLYHQSFRQKGGDIKAIRKGILFVKLKIS